MIQQEAKNALPRFHPARILCTWFGAGLSPWMPGTMGSLAALPFAYVIQIYFGSLVLLCAMVALFFLGWWASSLYLRNSFEHDNMDPREIVVDEVVGMWLLLSVLPLTLQSYVTAFVLFRLFDIIKPWPVSWVDRRLKSGLGVMLDDVLAGFYPVFLTMVAYTISVGSGKDDLIFRWLFWLNGHHG